jgi:hypothetical protein
MFSHGFGNCTTPIHIAARACQYHYLPAVAATLTEDAGVANADSRMRVGGAAPSGYA